MHRHRRLPPQSHASHLEGGRLSWPSRVYLPSMKRPLYTGTLQTSPKMAMNPDNSESNTQRCCKFFTAVQGGIDPCHTGACRRGAALGAGRRSRLCQPSIMAFQEQARRTYTIRRAEGTWEEYLRNIRTLSVVPERWMCWSCFRFALYGITPAAGRVPARCGE